MFGKKTVPLLFSILALPACADIPGTNESDAETKVVETLPYYHTPDFEPFWKPANPDTLHSIQDFEFTDHHGNLLNNEVLDGKIYLVNFFFTHCGSICPKMMRNMEKLEHDLIDYSDVLFVSHTVTPWIDSVPVLANYATNYDVVDARWFLVTGDKTEIYNLARKSYFVEEEPGFTKDSTEFLHTEHVVLIDRNRHIRGIYNGTLALEMDRAREDVLLLLREPR